MAKQRFDSNRNSLRSARRADDSAARFTYSEMRFVRIELTEAEKQEFKLLLEAGEFNTSFLDKCLAAGYSVTIGTDKRGNGVLCCIRAEFKDMLDGGLILSGRAGSVAAAVAVCEYKSNYLADENGWLEAETRRGGGYADIG